MRPVVSAAEMRALDRATIEDIGIPAFTLMETAGRAVAHVAMEMLAEGGDAGLAHVAVVCGPGNNGGDGFVAARVLRDLGVEAAVYLAVSRSSIRGDAAAHLAVYERAGGLVRMLDTPQTLGELGDAVAGAALAIDALFGVGLSRPLEGHFADLVSLFNHAPRRLAVDIPSGLDADTGRVLGVTVEADVTVTMGALKIALAGAPGFAHCGAVDVADIGIPSGVLATQAVRAGLVEEADVARWLPHARLLDHKGRRGHVVIIGGMPGMRGAGRLCANAALRAGAGLVTLATAGEVAADDSVMTRALATNVGELLANKSAIVIGPGLGQSEPAAGWVGEVLASGVPAVLDADALNLVAGIAEAVKQAAGPIVLTPHPGEAARLLGTTVPEIEADRLAAARALATRTHAVVVLKGARTIVCDGTLEDDHCSINPTGGPELATGGSGDVLAGVIGALLAQGLPAADAARAGVYVHGLAGEQLAVEHGRRGVISSDLPVAIAGVLKALPRPA
ncbi:MAG TPA: NAD(P)H-hydrate dehydratase [Kofleriaceae bacterium]|nr:NAD(P)H-hydrate dehydratase [Kofleriaceae bacterium]